MQEIPESTKILLKKSIMQLILPSVDLHKIDFSAFHMPDMSDLLRELRDKPSSDVSDILHSLSLQLSRPSSTTKHPTLSFLYLLFHYINNLRKGNVNILAEPINTPGINVKEDYQTITRVQRLADLLYSNPGLYHFILKAIFPQISSLHTNMLRPVLPNIQPKPLPVSVPHPIHIAKPPLPNIKVPVLPNIQPKPLPVSVPHPIHIAKPPLPNIKVPVLPNIQPKPLPVSVPHPIHIAKPPLPAIKMPAIPNIQPKPPPVSVPHPIDIAKPSLPNIKVPVLPNIQPKPLPVSVPHPIDIAKPSLPNIKVPVLPNIQPKPPPVNVPHPIDIVKPSLPSIKVPVIPNIQPKPPPVSVPHPIDIAKPSLPNIKVPVLPNIQPKPPPVNVPHPIDIAKPSLPDIKVPVLPNIQPKTPPTNLVKPIDIVKPSLPNIIAPVLPNIQPNPPPINIVKPIDIVEPSLPNIKRPVIHDIQPIPPPTNIVKPINIVKPLPNSKRPAIPNIQLKPSPINIVKPTDIVESSMSNFERPVLPQFQPKPPPMNIKPISNMKPFPIFKRPAMPNIQSNPPSVNVAHPMYIVKPSLSNFKIPVSLKFQQKFPPEFQPNIHPINIRPFSIVKPPLPNIKRPVKPNVQPEPPPINIAQPIDIVKPPLPNIKRPAIPNVQPEPPPINIAQPIDIVKPPLPNIKRPAIPNVQPEPPPINIAQPIDIVKPPLPNIKRPAIPNVQPEPPPINIAQPIDIVKPPLPNIKRPAIPNVQPEPPPINIVKPIDIVKPPLPNIKRPVIPNVQPEPPPINVAQPIDIVKPPLPNIKRPVMPNVQPEPPPINVAQPIDIVKPPLPNIKRPVIPSVQPEPPPINIVKPIDIVKPPLPNIKRPVMPNVQPEPPPINIAQPIDIVKPPLPNIKRPVKPNVQPEPPINIVKPIDIVKPPLPNIKRPVIPNVQPEPPPLPTEIVKPSLPEIPVSNLFSEKPIKEIHEMPELTKISLKKNIMKLFFPSVDLHNVDFSVLHVPDMSDILRKFADKPSIDIRDILNSISLQLKSSSSNERYPNLSFLYLLFHYIENLQEGKPNTYMEAMGIPGIKTAEHYSTIRQIQILADLLHFNPGFYHFLLKMIFPKIPFLIVRSQRPHFESETIPVIILRPIDIVNPLSDIPIFNIYIRKPYTDVLEIPESTKISLKLSIIRLFFPSLESPNVHFPYLDMPDMSHLLIKDRDKPSFDIYDILNSLSQPLKSASSTGRYPSLSFLYLLFYYMNGLHVGERKLFVGNISLPGINMTKHYSRIRQIQRFAEILSANPGLYQCTLKLIFPGAKFSGMTFQGFPSIKDPHADIPVSGVSNPFSPGIKITGQTSPHVEDILRCLSNLLRKPSLAKVHPNLRRLSVLFFFIKRLQEGNRDLRLENINLPGLDIKKEESSEIEQIKFLARRLHSDPKLYNFVLQLIFPDIHLPEASIGTHVTPDTKLSLLGSSDNSHLLLPSIKFRVSGMENFPGVEMALQRLLNRFLAHDRLSKAPDVRRTHPLYNYVKAILNSVSHLDFGHLKFDGLHIKEQRYSSEQIRSLANFFGSYPTLRKYLFRGIFPHVQSHQRATEHDINSLEYQ
ncbi:uncharacterized protein [Panulirus ornatus]|uniref:uncharacterized protein n=1 Tax=Panulirus ornatus TaxID=150431 RepID=UPI003A861C9E